ncbi:P-loop containing nucleoside triphosphate hydrolase protein [Pilaira anomala]|nr:P-loop containing nucleoside triphosphate hydrolase protein [Pilaira anomala]
MSADNYVKHLIDLVIEERKVALDQERKLILGEPEDLERKGLAILNLRVTILEPFSWRKHKIVAGDSVQIRESGLLFDPYDEENVGVVSDITPDEITVYFGSSVSIEGICNIVKFPSEETFRREAVRFSIGSEKISLIHGPPGTGKTHTLVEIVRQLVENQHRKVLVCAPSNTAVDNVLSRIIANKNIDFKTLRIGNVARMSPNVRCKALEEQLCLEYESDSSSDIDELNERVMRSLTIGEPNKQKRIHYVTRTSDQVLREADVIFCTLNGAGCAQLEDRRFDVLIIDEAGQATEPDCWIPILKADKIILCGDHLQLPPTVMSMSDKVQDPKPRGLSTDNDLTYTMFDRLLDMQGDNIKYIMKFSSQELYGNKLEAHHTVANHLLADLPNTTYCDTIISPVVLIDTSDTGLFHESIKSKESIEKSSSNRLEVILVVKYIQRLISNGGLEQSQIGIITPYTAQVFLLRDIVNDIWKDIEVNSIDGYQGREKKCIIISMVRSNKEGSVGFLSEKRRLNVAMTRAKRQLVVIGDTRTLLRKGRKTSASSPFNRKFLSKWIEWLGKNSNKQLSQEYVIL